MTTTFLPYPQNKKILIYRKGKVFSRLSKKYIGRPNPDGDIIVDIHINGKLKTVFVKQLVAELFVPNPDNLKTVINKNWNRADCRPLNLQWVNRSQAKIHALNKPKKKGHGNTKPKTDDWRADKAIEMKRKSSKQPPRSSTFISDSDHAETIFS